MPELPEVETVRRALAPLLEGRTIVEARIDDPRLVQPRDRVEAAAELLGETFAVADRRGKYLLLRLASGRVLVVHLRMTGAFVAGAAAAADAPAIPHLRALLVLDDSSRIAFRDVRRFGTWTLLEPHEVEPYLDGRLGPEPLGSFTAAAFAQRIGARHAPVKAVLLDQKAIAGVGNIYADEALWRASIHPLVPCADLAPAQLRSLHRAVRAALEAGIERQGATLRDYRAPDGSAGGMQDEFKVYGRDGEPCLRCGGPISKIRVAGRGTHFCPRCQPAPVRLAADGASRPAAVRRPK